MNDLIITYPYKFEGGEKAVASEVNANFDQVKQFASSVNQTINELQAAISALEKRPTREMFDIYFSITGETPVGAFPLWTGETITNCKLLYPDFWKKLNSLAEIGKVPTVASNEKYEEKISTYGQCASFYIDSLNGHVRLPKITRFISSIGSLADLAAEQNDANKTHSHNLRATPNSGNRSAATNNYLGSGTDNSKSDKFWSDNYTLENTAAVTASGDDEARPKNVRLCLYIQVANNTAEMAEFNTDVILEQLNSALSQLQTGYNRYIAQLTAFYESIKDKISTASPIHKDNAVDVEVSLWRDDTTYKAYPFCADIPNDDANEEKVPTVVFGVNEATGGNFAPVAECGNGYVRIWAKKKPTADFVIDSVLVV